MEQVRREVERIFDESLGEGGLGPWSWGFPLSARRSRVYPPLNISEDKDHVYLQALAPGLDPGTIDISVLQNQLRITGEKQALSEDIKAETFHRSERGSGHFTRTIMLPADVQSDKVQAEYKNGVLMLSLPKSEAAKPKQIAVSVE